MKDATTNQKVRDPMFLFPTPLPIPPDDWLRKANEGYRAEDLPPSRRPFRALEKWAIENGQPLENLLILHMGTPAWEAILDFFKFNTRLRQDLIRPLSRAAFYYDGSFYPMNLAVFCGGAGPSRQIDAFQFLKKDMPSLVLNDFSRDEEAIQKYFDHMVNVLDSLQSDHAIISGLQQSFAKRLLPSAAFHLDSAVANLLDATPSSVAAEHSRLSLECALKAYLAEKGGLTEPEAEQKIGHKLRKLLNQVVDRCPPIPTTDFTRLEAVANDSGRDKLSRQIFPDFGERYEAGPLPGQRLWACYAAAQHAVATVLRALGGLDSRELN